MVSKTRKFSSDPSRSRHGFADTTLHFLGFRAKHRGLVGHADFAEVQIGIETLGTGLAEFFEKRRTITAAADVVADEVRFREVVDDDKVPRPAAGRAGPRTGRAGLFVVGLAVDDGSHAVIGVLPHAFPHAHDVTARGVDDLATTRLDTLLHRHLGPEGGNDDHVLGREIVDVGHLARSGQRADAHGRELGVDVGVVDDFADEEEVAIGKDLAGGVSEIDSALDAVAKTELLGQAHGQVTKGGNAAGGAQTLDHRTVIVRFDGGLHFFHDLRGAEVDSLGRGRGGHRAPM